MQSQSNVKKISDLYDQNKFDDCLQTINSQISLLETYFAKLSLLQRQHYAILHVWRGKIHFHQQKLLQARNDFCEYILYDFKGDLLEETHRREFADLFVKTNIQSNFARATLTDEKEVVAYTELANEDMTNGFFSRARLRFDFLLTCQPYNYAMYANRVICYLKKHKNSSDPIDIPECQQAYTDINFAIWLFNNPLINTQSQLDPNKNDEARYKLYKYRRQLNLLLSRSKEAWKDHIVASDQYQKIFKNRNDLEFKKREQLTLFHIEYILAAKKFAEVDPGKSIKFHQEALANFNLPPAEKKMHEDDIAKLNQSIALSNQYDNLSLDDLFLLLEPETKEEGPTPSVASKKKKKKKKPTAPVAIIEPPATPPSEPIKIRTPEEQKLHEERKQRKQLKKEARKEEKAHLISVPHEDKSSVPTCMLEEKLPLQHKNLARFIQRLFNTLKKSGATHYYIVGGLPRFLASQTPGEYKGDIDIVTDAKLDDIEASFLKKGVTREKYKNFLLSLKNCRYHVDIVHSNHLLEEKGLASDAASRDFTIGALYLDEKGDILYPTLHGKADMEAKIINTIKPALESFEEDPIRILRAIYFANKIDFSLSDDILAAIQKPECVVSLKKNPGHTNAMVLKLLKTPALAVKCFNMLFDLGIFNILFPEINMTKTVLQDIVTDGSWRHPKPNLSCFYEKMLFSTAVNDEKNDLFSTATQNNDLFYYNFTYTKIKRRYYHLKNRNENLKNVYNWLHREIFNEKAGLNFKLLFDTGILDKMIEEKILPEACKAAWEKDKIWLQEQFADSKNTSQPGFCVSRLLVSTASAEEDFLEARAKLQYGHPFFSIHAGDYPRFIQEASQDKHPVSKIAGHHAGLFTIPPSPVADPHLPNMPPVQHSL